MHTDGVGAYREEDFLQLSGLQHFVFCRRQWALIHIENLWAENFHTTDGSLMHERVHDAAFTEKRGNTIISRGVGIRSFALGVSGQCDVVEFHRHPSGVPIHGFEGLWRPFPVEYKRGEPKEGNCDAAQLCAQALCLEGMLCCEIPAGALFYGERKRRTEVAFTKELRAEVEGALIEMHALARRGHTPRAKPSRACRACSLKDVCLPALTNKPTVASYLEEHV